MLRIIFSIKLSTLLIASYSQISFQDFIDTIFCMIEYHSATISIHNTNSTRLEDHVSNHNHFSIKATTRGIENNHNLEITHVINLLLVALLATNHDFKNPVIVSNNRKKA
jgi:hypothetical protein